MEYKHTQYGYTGILTMVLIAVVVWFSLPETLSGEPQVGTLTVSFIIAMVAVTFWLSRLVVAVAEWKITATFGLGKPHRVIQLTDVADVRRVRNRWIQGWGVRKISKGWMYNVWGLDAIEVELASNGIFRIGTDDADRLLTAISLSRGGPPDRSY